MNPARCSLLGYLPGRAHPVQRAEDCGVRPSGDHVRVEFSSLRMTQSRELRYLGKHAVVCNVQTTFHVNNHLKVLWYYYPLGLADGWCLAGDVMLDINTCAQGRNSWLPEEVPLMVECQLYDRPNYGSPDPPGQPRDFIFKKSGSLGSWHFQKMSGRHLPSSMAPQVDLRGRGREIRGS